MIVIFNHFFIYRVIQILGEFDELYGLTNEPSAVKQQLVRTTHTKLQLMVQEASAKLIKVSVFGL